MSELTPAEPTPKPPASAYRGFYTIDVPLSESAVAIRINEAVVDGTTFEEDMRVLAREGLRALHSFRRYMIFFAVIGGLSLAAGLIIGLVAIAHLHDATPSTTTFHY